MSSAIFTEIASFEQRLGMPVGFYEDLIREDDWSFVIKLNALFEAACTHILVSRLHAPELEESFSHLDLGHSKYGKVAMLRKLKSLSAEQVSILQLLYQLRNKLAHNIAHVSFSFPEYIAQLDKQQRDNFCKAVGHGAREAISIAGKEIPRNEFVLDNPKLSIWLTAAEVLACLHLEVEVAKLDIQKRALAEYVDLTRRSSRPAEAGG